MVIRLRCLFWHDFNSVKSSISERMSMSLEFLVGIMLVYLGFTSFLSYKTSAYASRKTSYLKSLGIGFVHGLAGSAAMVVVTMSTVTHVWQGALYIIILESALVLACCYLRRLLEFHSLQLKSK